MSFNKYDTITAAARTYGLPKSTLRCAVERGDVVSRQLASGMPVVLLSSVRRFAGNRPSRGPKVRKTRQKAG